MHIIKQILILSVGAGVSCHTASGSGVDEIYPLTRDRIQKVLRKTPDPNGLQLQPETLHGCISTPPKSFIQRLLVGERFTGEACTLTVKPNNTISADFLGNIDIPLADTSTKSYSTDIFLNQIQDNEVIIVQQKQGRVVSFTHTVYDSNGYVVFGGYGKGDFIKACVLNVEEAIGKNNCGGEK